MFSSGVWLGIVSHFVTKWGLVRSVGPSIYLNMVGFVFFVFFSLQLVVGGICLLLGFLGGGFDCFLRENYTCWFFSGR